MAGQFTQTKKSQYYTLRDTVSSADSDLTSAQKTWAYFQSNWQTTGSLCFMVPQDGNIVSVIFDHKNADDDTATFILYGYRDKGDAEFICTGQLTAGAQENNDSTARYYADTVSDGTNNDAVTSRWIGNIGVCEGGGDDGMAKVTFDTYGLKYVICLFTAISTSDNVRAKASYV